MIGLNNNSKDDINEGVPDQGDDKKESSHSKNNSKKNSNTKS